MATHLVTGYAGKAHIKSEDQGRFNASFCGDGQFVMELGNQCKASIIDNNTVRILDGDILMKGRYIQIEQNTYEDVVIENGTSGINRCDLIVMEYTKQEDTGVEKASIKVLKGTGTTGTAVVPENTDGDLLAGASLNQMPLYKVRLEGVVLTSIECLFEVKGIKKFKDDIQKKFNGLSDSVSWTNGNKEHYDKPLEIGQHIDMHFDKSSEDFDGRVYMDKVNGRLAYQRKGTEGNYVKMITYGSYKGNGSAETRTITISDFPLDNVLLVRSSSTFAIISPVGALCVTPGGEITNISSTEARFAEGKLTVASTSGYVNHSEVNYEYQVL